MLSNESFTYRVLILYKKWLSTDKYIIINNIDKYLYELFPECKIKFTEKIKKIMELSGSREPAVYAWMNRSREDVKVPFIKLCEIAYAIGIDVENFLIVKNKIE